MAGKSVTSGLSVGLNYLEVLYEHKDKLYFFSHFYMRHALIPFASLLFLENHSYFFHNCLYKTDKAKFLESVMNCNTVCES